jgi:hypothetical protein
MKWEYQTVKLNVAGSWKWGGVDFDTDKVQDFTNELGAQGWELVSAFAVNAGAGYSKEIVFIFKRPASE